jgi:ketosteroid isomerase-like protein
MMGGIPSAGCLRDTRGVMPEESTTPDLVELGERFLEAVNRRDLDAALSFFAPDAVWATIGLGTTFEGVAAIHVFWQDWWASYEELRIEPEEILDLGNGVTFSVIVQQGRLVGSTAHVQVRYAAVTTWADGLIERNTNYTDIDEARAAAERLAQEWE